jgi:hypothetical protein
VLNFIVPVVPKFVPVIVTVAPAAPEVGDRLVMFGAAVANVERPRRKANKVERTDISPDLIVSFFENPVLGTYPRRGGGTSRGKWNFLIIY